jgi:hypothetical protein
VSDHWYVQVASAGCGSHEPAAAAGTIASEASTDAQRSRPFPRSTPEG